MPVYRIDTPEGMFAHKDDNLETLIGRLDTTEFIKKLEPGEHDITPKHMKKLVRAMVYMEDEENGLLHARPATQDPQDESVSLMIPQERTLNVISTRNQDGENDTVFGIIFHATEEHMAELVMLNVKNSRPL